jgi:hypothetical protein
MALYGAVTWTLRATDQKLLESFEMWCWRRMEKIIWTDHVRNEKVLLRVEEQRSILHEISKRKSNWIDHFLRRNCLLQQVIEGKIKGQIEVTRRRGRRRKEVLDDLNRLTPNDPYMGRTAPLTSKRCILYIYSTNIGALYSPLFSLQDAVCFIMLTCLVPVLFKFCIQVVLKLKKIIPAPKG